MLTIKTWKVTCWACPFQVEGRLSDDSHFYFRYRFSKVRIGVGPDEFVAVGMAMDSIYEDRSEQEGDTLTGTMDGDEFLEIMARFLREYDHEKTS